MTAADDLTSVIAILAEACQEHYAAREPVISRAMRGHLLRSMLAQAERMRPVADDLVQCMAAGDHAGAERLLDEAAKLRGWRDLAAVLASDLAAGEAQRAA